MAKSKNQKRLEARDRAAANLVERDKHVAATREEIAVLERSLAARSDGTTFVGNFLGFTDRNLLASKQSHLDWALGRRATAWTELKRLNALCGITEHEQRRNCEVLEFEYE